jgi:hypothetical protein
MKIKNLLIAISLLFPINSYASAWLLEQGKYSISGEVSFKKFTDYTARLGEKTLYNVNMEYGALPELTFGINPNHGFEHRFKNDNGTILTQDEYENQVGFYAKYSLYKSEHLALSIQPKVSIPDFIELRLMAGNNGDINGINYFLNVEAAMSDNYRYYDANEREYEFSGGLEFIPDTLIIAKSTHKFNDVYTTTNPNLSAKQHKHTLQVSLMEKFFGNSYLEAGVFKDVHLRVKEDLEDSGMFIGAGIEF